MSALRPPPPPTARRIWALQTFVLLFLVWLALDGFDAAWIGLAFAGLGALLGHWLAPGEPYPWRPLRLLAFMLYFLRASLQGGVDVAWRALHPRLPIDPGYLDYRCSLDAGLPRSAFVGVVCLLPGTLSVDLDDDGSLRVHALNIATAADGLAELERQLAMLFSLDAPRSGRGT